MSAVLIKHHVKWSSVKILHNVLELEEARKTSPEERSKRIHTICWLMQILDENLHRQFGHTDSLDLTFRLQYFYHYYTLSNHLRNEP